MQHQHAEQLRRAESAFAWQRLIPHAKLSTRAVILAPSGRLVENQQDRKSRPGEGI